MYFNRVCTTLFLSALVFRSVAGMEFEAFESPGAKDNFHEARSRLWIPDFAKRIQGVLVLAGGTDSDWRGQISSPKWQALAVRNELALIGCYFRGDGEPYEEASEGSGLALMRMIDDLALKSNHSELAKTPLLLVGYSSGAMLAYNLGCWDAARIVALISIKSGPINPKKATKIRNIPSLFIIGAKDEPVRKRPILQLFQGRADSAWALAIESDSGHEWDSRIDPIVQDYISTIARISAGRNWKISQQFRDLKNPYMPIAEPENKADVMWFPAKENADQWANFTTSSSIQDELNRVDVARIEPIRIMPSTIELGSVSIRDFEMNGIRKVVKVCFSQTVASCEFNADHDNINLHCKMFKDNACELDLSVSPREVVCGWWYSSVRAIFKGDKNSCEILIPVRILIKSPITIRPRYLYLGVVKRDAFIERKIELKWLDNYVARVSSIISSKPEFASAMVENSSKSAIITCKFKGGALGNQSGFLAITFDNNPKTTVKIPFVAYVTN
jgi:predicted esterase